MLRRSFVLIASVALNCSLALGAGPDEATLLKQLEQRAPDRFFVVRQNEKPDSPILGIYGDLVNAHSQGEKATIDEFIKNYGTLLAYPAGATPPELLPESLGTGTGASHLLSPCKDGLSWIGGTVGFHFNKEKKLVAATGRYRAMKNLQGSGDHSAADILRKALATMRERIADVNFMSGDAVIYKFLGETDDGNLQPVYQMDMLLGERQVPARILVNGNGEILCARHLPEQFDADGLVYDGYPVEVHKLKEPIKKLRDEIKGSKRFPLDGEHFRGQSSAYYKALSTKGHFDFPTTFTMTFDSGTKRKLSHPRYLETSMYYHLNQAHDLALKLGVPEVDEPLEEGSTVKPVLTFDPWMRPRRGQRETTVNTAYYSHADKGFHFAWYNPKYGFRQAAADHSIIYHEYAHYLLHRLNPSFNLGMTPHEIGDGGALAEGFSDWFSMQASGGSSVGEIFYGSGKGRTATLKRDYVSMAPIYDKSSKDCDKKEGVTEIHEAGQLFSGLAMRLTSEAKEQLGKDEPESAARVVEAVRVTVPFTFRTFALSAMAVQMRHDDPAKLKALMDLWREAGLFKESPQIEIEAN